MRLGLVRLSRIAVALHTVEIGESGRYILVHLQPSGRDSRGILILTKLRIVILACCQVDLLSSQFSKLFLYLL